MNTSDILLLLGLVAVVIIYIYIKRRYKMPVVGSVALVTGAVKSGKTTFSLALARGNYTRSVRRWKLKKFFRKLFRLSIPEKPLFYSNIPVAFPYVPLTKDLLTRKKRFAYGSTVYVSEASLVADNSIFADKNLSERIMFFNKLFGHETCGGFLVYDTQAIGDLPVVTRRCLGQYFYVHHITKWIPFFLIAHVKECRYSEDGSVVSVDTEDLEDGLKKVIIRKSIWKKFDCYCYSVLTDNLPVENKVVTPGKKPDLTCSKVISFKEYKNL